MTSLNAEDDPVVDVLEKLKSGRRPAATVISNAGKQYTHLRKELQLYKDEIIEIKKAKNVEVPKEDQAQEQPSSTEIYKIMEASARHTAENECLREELKSAKSEIELLSKHVDDLKQEIECLRPENCREHKLQNIVNRSDYKVGDDQSNMTNSVGNDHSLEKVLHQRQKTVSDKEKKMHLEEGMSKEHNDRYDKLNVLQNTRSIVEALHNKTNGLHGLENDCQGKENDLQDNEEVAHTEMKGLNDVKKSLNDKEKDLRLKEGFTKDRLGKDSDENGSVDNMDETLLSLKEKISKLMEENRRLESNNTNFNRDLKLQQKITIDKERQVQTLEDDLHNLRDENITLKQENAHLKTENDRLNQQRLENEKEKHSAVVSVSSMVEETKKLRSENENLKGELRYANEKEQRHSRQINEMTVKSEMSSHGSKKEFDDLQVENIKLRQDLKKLLLKVEEAKCDKDKYREFGERSYRDEQMPRHVNKSETHELHEENSRLRHEVKQLKLDVANARYDRDQQRKQEESSYRKALRYKEESSQLMKEKEILNNEKVHLEQDLQRAKEKIELILGERNKENRNTMDFTANGFSKSYGLSGGHNLQLESKLKATQDHLQRLLNERNRDQQNVSSYKEDNHKLKKELDKMEHVNIRLERDLKKSHAILQQIQEEKDRLKSSPAKTIEEEYTEHLGKERLLRTNRRLDSESRATKDTMRKISEISHVRKENDSERQRVEDFRRTIERQKNQIKMLSEENRKLQNDAHDLRNRFSTLAGHKMTTDNPNIADLSDGYRPTNIAEQFREVYDNEWTHAYEELEKHYRSDEKRIIDYLLSILKKIESFCKEVSSQQFISLRSAIENDLTYPKYKLENGTVMAGKHRAEMSSSQKETEDKFLKDLRKSLGILSTGPLAQIFHEVHVTKELGHGHASVGLTAFIVQSVKLVWMMNMQAPPMVLLWAEPKQNVDKNRFTFYTKRGDIIKQCIWPALELHENGPLMSKGIVQAV